MNIKLHENKNKSNMHSWLMKLFQFSSTVNSRVRIAKQQNKTKTITLYTTIQLHARESSLYIVQSNQTNIELLVQI